MQSSLLLWTPESLHNLFIMHGVGTKIAAKRLLFRPIPATPTVARPGAPEHPTTDCLAWTGSVSDAGYGTVGARVIDGKVHPVHVVSWVLVHGSVPDGTEIGHRCECRPCARPDHVRPVSDLDNVRESAVRRWPDALLATAPPVLCRIDPLHGWLSPTIQLRLNRASRYFWAYRCSLCDAAYRAAKSRGVRAPSGAQRRPMAPDARAIVQEILDQQGEADD